MWPFCLPDSSQLRVVRQKQPVLNYPDTKCLLCSKARASLTPHLGETLLPPSLPQPGEAPGSAWEAISVDQFIMSGLKFRLWNFMSPPRQCFQQFCFVSEGWKEDKHIRDGWWWDCRCRSGAGGWRTAGGYRCSTSLLIPVGHRVFLTWYTHISEQFCRDKACIQLWKLWALYLFNYRRWARCL